MKTSKTVGIKRVVIAVAGLVALTSYGRTAYDPQQISTDIGKVENLLNPASKALSSAAKPGEASTDAETLKANIAKAAEKIATSGKVLKWRKDNEALNTQRDGLKTANSLPAILKLNIAKRREEQNTALKNIFSQLSQQPQSSMNPADFDMGNLHPQCQDGVDFTGFKSLADQMNTKPFQDLQEQGRQLISEKDKKAKEDKLANLALAAKEFDKLADKDDEEKAQKSVLDAQLSEEAQLDGLKQDNTLLKKDIKSLRKSLVKSMFTDLIPELSKIEENDERISQIAVRFADSLEGFRKASYESAIANVQRLKGNCEQISQEVGRDSPFAPGTLLGQAYQKVVEFHQGDANFYANTTFAAGVRQMVNNMRCPSATSQVDSLFGGQLQQAIASMRTAKDPQTLLSGAMTTLQSIASAQANVGPAVKRLAQKCDNAGKNKDKVQKFVQSTEQAIQQDQQQLAQAGQGTPRLQSGRGARTGGQQGPATHRAGAVQ